MSGELAAARYKLLGVTIAAGFGAALAISGCGALFDARSGVSATVNPVPPATKTPAATAAVILDFFCLAIDIAGPFPSSPI
jgi:hypothetical protein